LHEQLAQHLRSPEPKGHPPIYLYTPKGTWRNFGEKMFVFNTYIHNVNSVTLSQPRVTWS